MAQHNEFGKKGELFAKAYLEKLGYTIRDVNWRTGNMEIDIIAETNEQLIIVEVKTRAAFQPIDPRESITTGRIRRMVNAAHEYILQFDIDKEPRFDLIFLVQDNQQFQVEHIEDAFLPPIN